MNNGFCSITSSLRNDSIVGSATHFQRALLIEYNQTWLKDILTNNNLPASVQKFLTELQSSKTSTKIIFIKRSLTKGKLLNIFFLNNREISPFLNPTTITSYNQLLDLDYEQLFNIPSPEALPSMFLVCTHGKKDKCCAKFGLPIYTNMYEMGANVWQCSHIGGDRFAPNIIYLPHCHYYGHLITSELETLVKTIAHNSIYIPKYRGRSCYNKTTQTAEIILRNRLVNFDFNSLVLTSNQIQNDDSAVVDFLFSVDNTKQRVTLRKQISKEAFLLTCASQKKSHIISYTLESIEKIN